jgi:hypothetical protein
VLAAGEHSAAAADVADAAEVAGAASVADAEPVALAAGVLDEQPEITAPVIAITVRAAPARASLNARSLISHPVCTRPPLPESRSRPGRRTLSPACIASGAATRDSAPHSPESPVKPATLRECRM